MGIVKKTVKTGAGIILAKVAKEAFDKSGKTHDLPTKTATTVVGSLSAAASYHILKDDLVELVDEIKKGPKKE